VCGGVLRVWAVWAVWGSRPLLTFDIPQTALVATLDTYDFMQNGPCESKLLMVKIIFVIVFSVFI
jgi:hypothetical protein